MKVISINDRTSRSEPANAPAAMPPTGWCRAAHGDAGAELPRRSIVRMRGGTLIEPMFAGCGDSATHNRPDRRLRVGFVTPNLLMGGAERWIVNLLRYLDRRTIEPSGVAMLNHAPADPAICAEAARFAPVFGGPDGRGAVDSKGERPHPGPLPEGEGERCPHPGLRPEGEGSLGAQPRSCAADGTRSVHATLGPLAEGAGGDVVRFPSTDEALATLCERSDVIVAWGSSHLARLMAAQNFAGELVIVAHGSGASTVRMLEGSTAMTRHLVGVSRAAARAFREPRAIVIHNGADPARCAVHTPREVTRRQWGAAEGDVLVGYVGRFSMEKNPLAIAMAVKELGGVRACAGRDGRRPHPGPLLEGEGAKCPGPNAARFRAVFIGGGVNDDELKKRALAIAPDSIFVPPLEQIGDALAALDVFLLASPSEGFSLALTEAWLCGVPAVATCVGAVPELEERHGQLVIGVGVGASARELAAAVRRALGPEGRAVAERAKRVAWRHYTAQAMAERWSEFLLSVAGSREQRLGTTGNT